MENQVLANPKKYYLNEFEYYDGECFITFNIIDIDTARNLITVAVTNRGKISVCTFDLLSDGERFFFEYGPMFEEINVDDFEEVE